MSLPARRTGAWLAVIGSVAAVAAVAAALATLGSPMHQRRARLDDARVRDLIVIRDAVDCYFDKHGTVPADMKTALCERPGARVADPVTQRPYEYLPAGKNAFRLCAVFDVDTRRAQFGIDTRQSKTWRHPSGRHCFELRGRRKAEASRLEDFDETMGP